MTDNERLDREPCWSCGGTGTRRDGWRHVGGSWENDCAECNVPAQVASLERTVQQGRHWNTAREAAEFAAKSWGHLEAETPETAVEIIRQQAPEGTIHTTGEEGTA